MFLKGYTGHYDIIDKGMYEGTVVSQYTIYLVLCISQTILKTYEDTIKYKLTQIYRDYEIVVYRRVITLLVKERYSI